MPVATEQIAEDIVIETRGWKIVMDRKTGDSQIYAATAKGPQLVVGQTLSGLWSLQQAIEQAMEQSKKRLEVTQ